MQKTALIIGTGLGGLTTALRLAKRGYQVQMLEKYHQAGGRLNQVKKDGFTFDMGPSFFSMSYEFKEFAEFCDIELPFEFIELDPLYTVNIEGKKKPFVIYKDLKKLAKEFAEIEPGFEQKANAYLKNAGILFDDTMDLIVRQNYNNLWQFIGRMFQVPPRHLPLLTRSVWDQLNKYFDSNEVKQILSLVAFFLGGTPFDTSAVYTILSYTELIHDGYHNVRGGMYNIVKGLVGELEKENIIIHYNTEIIDYESKNGHISAFIDQNNQKWTADVYVANADAALFRNSVLKRPGFSDKALDRMKWTMAPLTIYLGIEGKIDQLDHHNYFLRDNFKEYSGKIFKNQVSLDKPYYYVNVLSRYNDSCAPEGCENLFILCPVPHMQYKSDWSDREEIADNIISDLSNRIGYDIDSKIISKTIMDPVDWKKSFNLHHGSGLGLAHGLTQIAGFRPKNFDEKYNNLYYVGASTVPGTGLPMTVISSKLVVERILKDHGTLS